MQDREVSVLTEPLTPEIMGQCRALRQSGLTWVEVSMITGIPRAICRQIVRDAEAPDGPEWPKLVTRIEADGSAMIVRVL